LLDAGWEPGPVFARVLESLYDLQLAGDAADRAALLEHLASLGVKEQGPGRAQGADSNENRINPG
jgi:hypothetical protein